MLIKSSILALLLSQPVVTPDMLDMTYKPCVDAYNIYVDIKKEDPMKAKLVGEDLVYLCAPIKNQNYKEM